MLISMDLAPQKDNSTEGQVVMENDNSRERAVVVHTAGTATEAMVIRALLESAGIRSPGSVSTDPFPLREPPEGTHGVEILVLESHALAARELIADYQRAEEEAVLEESPESADGEPPSDQ